MIKEDKMSLSHHRAELVTTAREEELPDLPSAPKSKKTAKPKKR